jgi:hypothetical protein
MRPAGPPDDIAAIESLIARQFESLCWQPDRPADWEGFARDFLEGAPLYPSARPAKAQTVPAFVQRMQTLSQDALKSFHERPTGIEVRVFGKVAVAIAACENLENGSATNHNVEMLLLVKDGAAWKIAAQAWDKVTADNPLPDFSEQP